MTLEELWKDEAARDELAQRICREIQLSEDGKGSLPRRWEQNEALYNLDPKATNLNVIEGMASYPVPLWKPKADRIVGTVFKATTGVEPYVQLFSFDSGDKEERIEDALMVLASRGRVKRQRFDPAFHMCLKTAVNTNAALLYVWADPESWDVCFRCVHPKDACVYPHEMGSVEEVKTIGHRFTAMRSEIEARFRAGEYLTDEVGGADLEMREEGKSASFARTEPTGTPYPEDEVIECWQVVTTWEGTRVLAVVAPRSQKLLKVVAYPYSRPFYFAVRFADEYGSFWPASSPGQDAQALQILYSDLFNVVLGGSYAAAFPTVVIEGGVGQVKVKKMSVGSVLELPKGFSASVLQTTFNPGVMPQMIEKVENVMDAVSGISQLGISQNLPASTSATAANGLLQAQSEAKDAYSTFVAPVVADVFEFLFELLGAHYEQFLKRFGDAVRVDREGLRRAYTFEPTGRSAASSPSVLLSKLQMLLQMASQQTSSLDYAKVEDQVVQTLQLPLDHKSLLKKADPAQLLSSVQEMLEAGASPQQILAGVQQALMADAKVAAGPQAAGSSAA